MIQALKLCLESNNSLFNNKHFLQTDDFAQSPHMPCSYSDIAIESFDKKALHYHPSVIGWKRFRYDAFLVWPHSREDLDFFFNYMNNIDNTKKIQFTMEVAKDILEFLDLQLKFHKKTQLYGPFLWMGFNGLKVRATSRRQLNFYHKFPEIPATHFIDLRKMTD